MKLETISFILSFVFFIIAKLKPNLLFIFYKQWIRLGDFLGSIISKIILAVMFYGLFTPISFILKVLNKDLLNKNIDASNKSYWIIRKQQPQSMKNQF